MNLYLIAGGTASGKTTIAKNIWESINKEKKINLIQLDDYYFPFSVLKEKFNVKNEEEINWDHPSTINFQLLKKHLKQLENGEVIKKSKFIYNTNEYSKTEFTIYNSDEITIIEGIHALYDEELNEKADLKIYVHADADIRLIRRIKRDSAIYGEFDSEKFLDIWEKQIRDMHNIFIEPKKHISDLIISTNNQIKPNFNQKIIELIKDSIINDKSLCEK